MIRMLAFAFWTCAAWACFAENPATVKEHRQTFTTYPYSDPSPIPATTGIYPYFRFDGYTSQPAQQAWKVVELENDYLRILILPEIGGKVWAAIEKSTGKPFLYYNRVVKFRDVALRGPWTSGGIEANYGIIGHTPNCATPVDYLTRVDADGSASCIIGALDLLTRTAWRVEIRLPRDCAYFTTRSFWHNATPLEQSYYSWMNAGIKAAGNLQLICPGTDYLGHAGEHADWPLDKERGKDLSFYDRNDFGGYKSYHVFGRYTEFFGGYWHDEDFGMARCARHDDKPGKKIWIWGLSREGMIWEPLLTDADGQYVEVQSGRLFNQAMEQSTRTPFKHRGFSPYATDTWTEYWFPVKQTQGFVQASPHGALNVKQESGGLTLRFCPVQAIHDKLEVFDGSRLAYSKQLTLKPMQVFSETVPGTIAAANLSVRLAGHKLAYSADPRADVLSRPRAAPADFNWKSVYGRYVQGKEHGRQRQYAKAAESFRACLQEDPNYLPALVELAALDCRRMDSAAALQHASKALSTDTYDPAANYYYGLANQALGRLADAKDGFDLAVQSVEYRGAAYTELSKLYLRERDLAKALDCAAKSTDFLRENLEGRQVAAVARRLQGDSAKAQAELEAILAMDPLNHFARAERYLSGAAKPEHFTALIRNELPREIYLELAAWYYRVDLPEDAAKILELAPRNAEVHYWLAYLKRDAAAIQAADAAPPHMVFPFRAETAEALQWAVRQSGAWQPRYYLALIHWDRNDPARVKELLAECGGRPDYAPYYAFRAEVLKENAEADLQRAAELDPAQWRFGLLLANHYLASKAGARALEVTERYVKRFPENYLLGMLRAKALLASGRYQDSSDVLRRLNVLPNEGALEGRKLYREVQLMLALEHMKNRQYDRAAASIEAARLWPENLGAGKPYAEDVDERLEDWLAATCHRQRRDAAAERAALERILRRKSPEDNLGNLLTAWAMKEVGKAAEGQGLLAAWREKQPESEVAKWCLAAFAGQDAELPESLRDESYRVLQAWRRMAPKQGKEQEKGPE